MKLEDWIRHRELTGQVTFSSAEVTQAFSDKSDLTLKRAILRAIATGRIQSVRSGFYVIVPPQYALKGVVPASYYLDAMMHWMKKPYYACLLTAAAFHGAGHQRAMQTQVMTIPPKAHSSQKNTQIQWNYRQQIPEELLQKANAEMGVILYSNPELTAVDLIQYASHIGGYQRAATVLAELVDAMDMNRMTAVFPYAQSATLQRLGYILEFVLEETEAADTLYSLCSEQMKKLHTVKMGPQFPRKEGNEQNRWRVNMNIDIDIDEI